MATISTQIESNLQLSPKLMSINSKNWLKQPIYIACLGYSKTLKYRYNRLNFRFKEGILKEKYPSQ
jgi:hypothetical protein